LKSTLLPYLRSVKLLKLRTQTRARCVFPPSESRRLPVRFIIGCGRSGTTILGRVLSLNEHTTSLDTPFDLDPGTSLLDFLSDEHGASPDQEVAHRELSQLMKSWLARLSDKMTDGLISIWRALTS